MDFNDKDYLQQRVRQMLSDECGELAIIASSLNRLSAEDFNATTTVQKFELDAALGELYRVRTALANKVAECFPKLKEHVVDRATRFKSPFLGDVTP